MVCTEDRIPAEKTTKQEDFGSKKQPDAKFRSVMLMRHITIVMLDIQFMAVGHVQTPINDPLSGQI
jgi:hypothetical protein